MVISLSPERLEAIALDACHAAIEEIARNTDRRVISTKSGRTDIVTATDVAAERAIRSVIASAAPGSSVLGEEGGQQRAGAGPHVDIEWVVDPVDGTVNFAYGLPITAVSVAGVHRGRAVAGAVIDVERRERFSAHLDGGAKCERSAIHVSDAADLDLALLATGYPYDAERRGRHGRTIGALVSRVRDVRCFGSAALHFCWAAAGRLDAYLERDIRPWDHAAGALIAREAGAYVELPCVENDHLVLVANPELFAQLRPLL